MKKRMPKEIAYDMRTIDIKISKIEDFRKKPQGDLADAVVRVDKMYREVVMLMEELIKKIGENNER